MAPIAVCGGTDGSQARHLGCRWVLVTGGSDDRLLRLCRRLGSESFTGDWWAHKDMEGCRGRGSDGQRRPLWDLQITQSTCRHAQVENHLENLLWAELQ